MQELQRASRAGERKEEKTSLLLGCGMAQQRGAEARKKSRRNCWRETSTRQRGRQHPGARCCCYEVERLNASLAAIVAREINPNL